MTQNTGTRFWRSFIYRSKNDDNGDKIIILNCLEANGYVNNVVTFGEETEYKLTDKGVDVYGRPHVSEQKNQKEPEVNWDRYLHHVDSWWWVTAKTLLLHDQYMMSDGYTQW